jgi:hypothetical protein
VLFGVQSVLEKQDQLTGMYYDYAMAAPVMAAANRLSGINQPLRKKTPLSVLILGMGSGTYDHQCRAYFKDIEIEGVEIDEKITDLAHQYFELPDDAKVTTYDGRAYLAAVDQKYDVIMVDAYQDITIPFQMSSAEFFEETAAHLNEHGVMVVNMNLRSEAEDGINTWLQDTIASVYPHVSTVDVPGNTNRILFAATQRLDSAAYQGALNGITTKDPGKRARLLPFLRQIPGKLTAYESTGHILTDDRAPVEVLSMRAIDQLIAEELAVYKELYREEGMQGVLEDIL